jgi:hypothetical protein
MRTLTTLGLASAFVGGSVVIAAAQSTSQNWMNAPAGGWSSATHCIDRVTQQPKLKNAAAPSGAASGSTVGSSTASPSGSASSTSGSASGSASSGSGSTAGLQPCP